MALSHEYGKREVDTKKRLVPEPGKFKRPVFAQSKSPNFVNKKLMNLPHIRHHALGTKKFDNTER